MTAVVNLRVENRESPLAIAEVRPRFGWQLSSDRRDVVQSGYRLWVTSAGETLWDSGNVVSDRSNGVEYEGPVLPASAVIDWSVTVTVSGEEDAPASASAVFETAPASELWDEAAWITHRRTQYQHDDHRPAPYLRTRVEAGPGVTRARLHVTAGGVVETWIEGERLDTSSLTPGWTDYRRRVPFHSYDVTRFFTGAAVTVGAVVADGWYSGGVGPFHKRNFWGKHPVLKAILVVDRVDGSRQVFSTGTGWEGAFGEIQSADLLQGEVIDARLRLADWSLGSGVGWRPVTVESGPEGRLVPALIAGAAPVTELSALAISEPQPGSLIVDFGQNFAGHIRLTANAPAGTIVRVRHAEVLDNGAFYTENLRGARATDTFIFAGGGETFEPSFTYHGFRYAEITGLPSREALSEVVGVPVSSIHRMIGDFSTGNALVDQLQHNIQWSMFSNFIEVPTDCPSRDERIGWTGDAQIFAPTATFNADLAAFYTKWMNDIDDTRMANGALPDIAPAVVMDWAREGSSGYAEAGLVVPWVMYQAYGDTRILERFFEAGAAWVSYVAERSPDLVWRENRNTDYGDWLAPEETPKDLTATAYFARSTQLLAWYAQTLGWAEKQREYDDLHARIAAAFRTAFVNADGTMPAGTQTAYTLALRFDLLLPEQREVAAEALARNVEERGHISTGFLAVAQIMPLLSEIGRSDLAYRLLLNEEYPSWGHHIKHGATTIWERWDGWRPETGFQDPLMNSFNHFALGSVGEWLYSYVAGLRSAAPGYAHLCIEPRVNRILGGAKAAHESVRGPITTEWSVDGERLSLALSLPANTGATVVLPCASVLESGHALVEAKGIRSSTAGDGSVEIEVGSGDYLFTGEIVGQWSAEGALQAS